MNRKKLSRIEYEVTPLDLDGDITEVLFFSSRKDAERLFNATDAPVQLWKVKHSATGYSDGCESETDRFEALLSQKLIVKRLYG